MKPAQLHFPRVLRLYLTVSRQPSAVSGQFFSFSLLQHFTAKTKEHIKSSRTFNLTFNHGSA
jgi:hypothetical protein